jgi:hypothetical protein
MDSACGLFIFCSCSVNRLLDIWWWLLLLLWIWSHCLCSFSCNALIIVEFIVREWWISFKPFLLNTSWILFKFDFTWFDYQGSMKQLRLPNVGFAWNLWDWCFWVLVSIVLVKVWYRPNVVFIQKSDMLVHKVLLVVYVVLFRLK